MYIVIVYFGLDVLFVNIVMKFLIFCYDYIGLFWWVIICVVIVGLKVFVVFFLSVYVRKVEGRRSLMNEKMVIEFLL